MAAPIGISVGDFIATIKLFKDIANALDEHKGAQSHYQHTVRNLETVQALLSRLESFHSSSGQNTQINAIRAQAQAIDNEVQLFLQKIHKFKATLGSGAPTGKRYGVIDKIKWSKKQAKEAAKLSDSVDVQLRNIQVLLDLDLSERSDVALKHHEHVASGISSLPTRHELISSTSQTVDETHVAARNINSRVDRAEAALLLRLDSLEQGAQNANHNMAKTQDLQDLRTYIDSRLLSAKPDTSASARLVLTLTIPQLQLSRKDMVSLFERLSVELTALLQALSICLGSMLAFFVLVVPKLVLLQRTLRRLPAAISLALNDNMAFEDALGRFHSLQFQQFRHWKVFESSLQCIFEDTPGIQKILKGHFILTPENQPAIAINAANYSALVKPGYAFKMSMAMRKLTAKTSRCPTGCTGNVDKVSAVEYRCKNCKLQYSSSFSGSSLTENGEPEIPKTGLTTQTMDADASEFESRNGNDHGPQKNTTKTKKSTSDGTTSLNPRSSALVLWQPPAFDLRELFDRWERAEELAEMRLFKRVHIKVSEPENQGYFKSFFSEEKELGRGSTGVVLLVQHVLDGIALGQFACKRVPIGGDHAWLEKLLVEVQLLGRLSHQNLVSYRHVWDEDFQLSVFGPRVPCVFILQQYCNGGDLLNYLYPPGVTMTREQLKERMRRRSKGIAEPRGTNSLQPRLLSFEELYSFFKDITAGLRFLHKNGYIHRDLKPTNCLLHTVANKTRVLVSDFGEVQRDSLYDESFWDSGSISFCAPEVLARSTPFPLFTTKSDVFSLGMILYFLCFVNLPYPSANIVHEELEDTHQLRKEVSSWQGFSEERRLRPDLPNQLYRMLKSLLSVDPNDRPSVNEMYNSMLT